MVKIANCIANISPSAILLVVTNPVNSMVPLISEVFKEVGFDIFQSVQYTTVYIIAIVFY